MGPFKRTVYSPPAEGLPFLAVLLVGTDVRVLPAGSREDAELLLSTMLPGSGWCLMRRRGTGRGAAGGRASAASAIHNGRVP